jgi:hypothetical protein
MRAARRLVARRVGPQGSNKRGTGDPRHGGWKAPGNRTDLPPFPVDAFVKSAHPLVTQRQLRGPSDMSQAAAIRRRKQFAQAGKKPSKSAKK